MTMYYGYLRAIDKEEITAKSGKRFTVNKATVEQTNGTTVVVDLGFNVPKNFHIGNFYEIDTEKKFGKDQYKGHTQASEGSAPAPSAAPAGAPPHYQKDIGWLAKQFPVPIDHPDRSIIRQNAMAHAMKALELSGCVDSDPSAVIDAAIQLAMKVEDFTTGDYEYKMLDSMGKEDKGE